MPVKRQYQDFTIDLKLVARGFEKPVCLFEQITDMVHAMTRILGVLHKLHGFIEQELYLLRGDSNIGTWIHSIFQGRVIHNFRSNPGAMDVAGMFPITENFVQEIKAV
jgi:hypothetical protein